MTSALNRAAIGAFIACIATSTASAQDSATLWDYTQGAPTFKDSEGNKLKIRGRILWDVAFLEEETDSVTTSIEDNEFRAARLGLEGQYKDVKYKFETDFAGSEIEVKDLYVTYIGGPVDVTIGQQKTPNSFEEEASSRHIDFIERAQLTDAFGFDRRVGVSVGDGGDNYSWRAGVFRNSVNGMQDNQDENTVAAVRGTYALASQPGNVIHIGGSYRYTNEDNSGAPSHSSRWGSHLASEKTKAQVGGGAKLYALEGAVIKGPFHAYGEYVTEEGNLGSANGYYVSTGVFLTGEVRNYKASAGTIDRTKPNNPVSQGGLGALSLNARYDVIDAREASDEQTTSMSAGLTWTLETHLNVKAEYTVADGDTFDASGFNMRFQYDW